MKLDFKNINVGSIIKNKIKEREIELSRICRFFSCTEDDVNKMLQSESLDSELLLKWSKLLEYDIFRIYSQHLILYAPSSACFGIKKDYNDSSALPKFRKNIYTREIIDFILEQIDSGELTKVQIIEKYRIPKTTLYKWINKYKN